MNYVRTLEEGGKASTTFRPTLRITCEMGVEGGVQITCKIAYF